MKTTIVVGIILLGLGYFIGQSGRVSPSTQDVAPPVESRANNAEEIHSLKARIAELEKELAAKNKTSQVPAQNAPVKTAEESSALEMAPATSAEPRPSKNWRAAERTMARVSSPSEISHFLQQVRPEDFLKEVQSARPIQPRDEIIEYLNGIYTGSMASQSTEAGFSMTMDTLIEAKNGSLQGRMSIRLSRGGKTFSRTSNRGDVQSVQRLGEKSLAVVISAGDYHFQLYYLPQLESFEGNCYRQIKPGTLEFVGTIHLERA